MKERGRAWSGKDSLSDPGAEGSIGINCEACGERTFQTMKKSLWPGPGCQRAPQPQEQEVKSGWVCREGGPGLCSTHGKVGKGQSLGL